LPNVPELTAALTQTTYTFQGDRLLLESKDQTKLRLGYSPDHMDALMLTCAAPVVRKGYGARGMRREAASYIEEAYSPYAAAYNIALPDTWHGVWRGIGGRDGL